MIPAWTSAAETSATTSDSLEEVVITASKRPEPAKEVGESVSVITSGDIERAHVTSLLDVSAAVPGLIISPGGSPGQTNIALRGFPALDGPAVATIIDDASVGSSTNNAMGAQFQLDLLPYDIERIEVLRGPQGTLYGANSMSGVLKYVTKYPSLTAPEAQLGAELLGITNGGSPAFGVHAAADAPLVDGLLAIRASAYSQDTPGFIRNPLLGLNHENELAQRGGRIAALWQLQSNFSVRLQAIYQNTESEGNAVVLAERLGTSTEPFYRPGAWLGGDLTHSHAIPEPFRGDVRFLSATVNWNFVGADLISATAYGDQRDAVTQDVSPYLGYLLQLLDPKVTSTRVRFRTDLRVKRASEEIRLASAAGRSLQWLVGAYVSHENATNDQALDALDSQLALIPNLGSISSGSLPTTYTENAVFGTLTYPITRALDVSAGLRWLHNRQSVNLETTDISSSVLGPPGHSMLQSSDHATNYTLGARAHASDHTLIYVRIASGYEPGGPNATNPLYPEIPPFTTSDTMVNYEVGLKSESSDHRASLDLAVYKMNWSALQLSVTTPDGVMTYNINAGKVTSEGFELTLAWAPFPYLRAEVNTAYMDAYASQAVPAVQIATGARLGLPKWTAAGTIDCRAARIAGWETGVSGSWRYIAPEYNTVSSQSPVGVVPGYSWVDLNLHASKGAYELSLYVKNAFEKRTYNNAIPSTDHSGASFFSGAIVPPRLIGLSVSARIR
jgi:iron complex outermembrane receptor protein